MNCRVWNGEGKKKNSLIVLVHGFPDCSLGMMGVGDVLASMVDSMVVAPDMRGCGFTELSGGACEDEDFQMRLLCEDVLQLVHALGFQDSFLVGHDWGGSVVWNLALLSSVHGSKWFGLCKGVVGFCTPAFLPPLKNPWPQMQKNPGRFAYQLWFHTQEAVDALESDYEKTVDWFLRAHGDGPSSTAFLALSTPSNQGITLPIATTPSRILSPSLRAAYVCSFRKSGFLNPLRWYRNVERNWLWLLSEVGAQREINGPALMVTAGKDDILTSSMSRHMESFIPQLQRAHIEQSGHFILLEHPEAAAKMIADFYWRCRHGAKL